MRIAVISPHTTNNGNTTLAVLLGYEFASTEKKTCLAHLNTTSVPFQKYFKLNLFDDKTSTPSQIVNILKEGDMDNQDIPDYCIQITDSFDIFTNTTSNFDIEDMRFMYRYIANFFPYENVIFDVDTADLEDTKEIVELCDVVVLNLTQSIIELDNFNKNKKEYMEFLNEKPMIVVVNKYNSIKAKLSEVAKWIGVKKPNGWLTLHENPWIAYGCNHGDMNTVYKKIKSKDKRVIEIYYELNKIAKEIVKAKVAGDKKAHKKRK